MDGHFLNIFYIHLKYLVVITLINFYWDVLYQRDRLWLWIMIWENFQVMLPFHLENRKQKKEPCCIAKTEHSKIWKSKVLGWILLTTYNWKFLIWQVCKIISDTIFLSLTLLNFFTPTLFLFAKTYSIFNKNYDTF